MEKKPEINILEALRYLGVSGEPVEELLSETREIAEELQKRVSPKYTYRVYDLSREGGDVLLGVSGVRLQGESSRTMLESCEKAVLLACTIGEGFEAMLRREQARNMARAVSLDACGSAYVEAGCDMAEREIRERLPGWYLTDRFSPGYGDISLEVQSSIFAALELPKRLGIHLTESLLMTPSKSVTAIIGLSKQPQRARIRGCAYCSMRESCEIRKTKPCYISST